MIGMSMWCGCGLGEVGCICGPFVTAPSLPIHYLPLLASVLDFVIHWICVYVC